MKIIRNEKGYTLILTLIIIIVIVSLFSTFAFGAITQQKQVEITDDTYEVTAIAEMGVEYYKAEILNLIEFYRQKTIDEVKVVEKDSELTGDEKHNAILTIDTNNISDLKSKVLLLYNPDPTDKTALGNSNSKYFALLDDKLFSEEKPSQIDIEVVGHLLDKSKLISAKFRFPTHLVTSTPIGSGSGNDNDNHLIDPPDFSITFPTNKCVEPIYKNTKACYTNNLLTLTTLNNNIVFYTGNEIKSFPQSSNKDYNNSYIYANGKVYFNWLNNNKNLTIQIHGEGTLPQFKNAENISVYLQGLGWHDEISGKTYKLYGEGNQVFKSTVNLENSIIEVKGEIEFTNSTTFDRKTKLSVSESAYFNNTVSFDDSEAAFSGSSTFNNSTSIKNNSTLKINSTATFKNTLDIINSKLYISGISTFNNDLRVSDGSFANFTDTINAIRINSHNNSTVCLRKSVKGNPGLNIDNSSNIYILDDTGNVKQSTPYKNWGSKHPVFLNSKAFESLCPNNEAVKPGNDYEYSITPILPEDDFTLEINYN